MPKPDHIGTCSTCAYHESEQGQCRFNPPILIKGAKQDPNVGDDVILSVFPTVKDDDWCGKWDDPAIVAIIVEDELAKAYANIGNTNDDLSD